MKVRPANCARARSATVAALASAAGGTRSVWNLFSMRHRLVGQLIFAVDSLATFVTSGKSPTRSAAPVCTKKSTYVDRCERTLIPSNPELCEAGHYMLGVRNSSLRDGA